MLIYNIKYFMKMAKKLIKLQNTKFYILKLGFHKQNKHKFFISDNIIIEISEVEIC